MKVSMFKCIKGHKFSETEARGKIIKNNLPYFICPFCGEEVYGETDPWARFIINLADHERKLDAISERLERLFAKLNKKRQQHHE